MEMLYFCFFSKFQKLLKINKIVRASKTVFVLSFTLFCTSYGFQDHSGELCKWGCLYIHVN